MTVIQTPHGWYNPERGTLTSYDPATGQLTTRGLDPGIFGQRTNPQLIQQIQNGQLQGLFDKGLGSGISGRSNVNIASSVQRAADVLMQQYPQMKWEDAVKYANKWVTDRIAAGHDANEIEDFAKGALRDDKNLGDEMRKGMGEMVFQDELAARNANVTGEQLNPTDPRGSIQDELRAFAGRMMSVLPPDHPQVKRIAELAAQAGNKYATQSGMGPGGIVSTGVANTTARAMVDLQNQREGIGAQALAAAGNQQLSVDALNTQLQQGNQQANTLQGSNIGGLIGSGIGAVGGIIGAAYTGGSMAPAIPGLIQAGGSAGQAIGGIGANASQGPIQYGGTPQQPRSTYAGRKWGVS